MIVNLLSWQRWRFLMIACFSTLVIVTACSPRQSPTHSSPNEGIPIGVIAPLTGSLPGVGESTRRAAELAAEEVNQQGGLTLADGQQKKVTLLMEDSQDDPAVALQVAQRLITEAGAIALVGPQASQQAIPVAQLAEQSKIPLITPWSTAAETTQGKSYVFRVGFIDVTQGKVLAQFALNELQAKTAGIIYNLDSDYNRGLAWSFRDIFAQAPGTTVVTEAYGPNTTNYTEQLISVLASKPDVLFLPNYDNEVPVQIKQASEFGLQGLTLMGGDTWSQLDLSLYPRLEGAYFTTLYSVDHPHPANQAFVKRYQAAYGFEPDDVAALTYDAFGVLFEAIAHQGQADREAVRMGLGQIQGFSGVTGDFDYQNGGDPQKRVSIVQVKAGKAVLYREVSPEELSAKP